MSLPPTAGHPLYGAAKQEVLQVRRNQARIAECFGAQDGLTESGRPLTHEDLEVESVRFFKKSCGKSVRAWRNKKTFMFVPKPHYVE